MAYMSVGKEDWGMIGLYRDDSGYGFNYGLSLATDIWEDQTVFLASRRNRCIARPSRAFPIEALRNGYDLDSYTYDLVAFLEGVELKNAIYLGHTCQKPTSEHLSGVATS